MWCNYFEEKEGKIAKKLRRDFGVMSKKFKEKFGEFRKNYRASNADRGASHFRVTREKLNRISNFKKFRGNFKKM